MHSILKLSALIIFVFLASCSTEDDNNSDISNSNLSGTVFGESFTSQGGKAFNSGDNISINITNINANCTSTVLDYDLYVSTTVLFEVGTYNNVNVVFHKDDETNPLNVLQSTVIIEEITATSITVKIKSEADFSDNSVAGTFTVDYCP